MAERRRFSRFLTELKGHYFLKDRKRGWNECTIIDVSRKGLGAEFHTQEKINVGSTAHLEIMAPGELQPVMLKGILRWIKQRENDFVCGIELTEILDDFTFAKLS
jgi:hypothetical protein